MILILVLVACLFLSFLFSGMETGILLLNLPRVRHLREQGSFGARVLLDFLQHPGRLSSTVLVGNTVVNGIALVLVAEFFLSMGGAFTSAAAVFLFSLILWLYGDVIPKELFRKYPTRLSTRFALLLWMTYVCLWPIVQVFNILSLTIVKALGGRISSGQMFVTRDELKLLAQEMGGDDSHADEQRNLIASILECHHTTVREVMRPLPEVITVKSSQTEDERRAVSVGCGFSRLPIVSPTPNTHHPWDGVWVVYDTFFLGKSSSRTPPRLLAEASLDTALASLRQAHTSFGFVKDKEGNEIGILTVEDVLARYLGKIQL